MPGEVIGTIRVVHEMGKGGASAAGAAGLGGAAGAGFGQLGFRVSSVFAGGRGAGPAGTFSGTVLAGPNAVAGAKIVRDSYASAAHAARGGGVLGGRAGFFDFLPQGGAVRPGGLADFLSTRLTRTNWVEGAQWAKNLQQGTGRFMGLLGPMAGPVGGALTQMASYGPAAAIGLGAFYSARYANAQSQMAGQLQERAGTAELGAIGREGATMYGASTARTQRFKEREAISRAGIGTRLGEQALIRERYKQDRYDEPSILSRTIAQAGSDISTGYERAKSDPWAFVSTLLMSPPGSEKNKKPTRTQKLRRRHNELWLKGLKDRSFDEQRELEQLREDPLFLALEVAKREHPELFGESNRGMTPAGANQGLAGKTVTSRSAQVSAEDLRNAQNKIIYSILQSQGVGP